LINFAFIAAREAAVLAFGAGFAAGFLARAGASGLAPVFVLFFIYAIIFCLIAFILAPGYTFFAGAAFAAGAVDGKAIGAGVA
jgi:hypothetical protein